MSKLASSTLALTCGALVFATGNMAMADEPPPPQSAPFPTSTLPTSALQTGTLQVGGQRVPWIILPVDPAKQDMARAPRGFFIAAPLVMAVGLVGSIFMSAVGFAHPQDKESWKMAIVPIVGPFIAGAGDKDGQAAIGYAFGAAELLGGGLLAAGITLRARIPPVAGSGTASVALSPVVAPGRAGLGLSGEF